MRLDFVLVPCFCLCLVACYDIGLGDPGTGMPLPAGGVPVSQTMEGGAQIQLTATGLNKLVAGGVAALRNDIAQGVCVSPLNVLNTTACNTNQGACTPGCAFAFIPQSVSTSFTNSSTIRVQFQTSASASVRMSAPLVGSCTLSLTVGSVIGIADVGVSIDPATGNLGANILQINQITSSSVSSSGCGFIPNLSTTIDQVIQSMESALLTDAVVPSLNATLSNLLPTPRELAAVVDLPALALIGPAASNDSGVETRLVPGGYAALLNGGLSFGVITGFNSDADPLTRSTGLTSEPDACVPSLTAPDLTLPPDSLPTTMRGTLALMPADGFVGAPMPAGDLLIGVSRSALDLAGHHIVASGGMCLTLDSSRADFVRRDVLDDLVGIPLASSDAELRLAVYPQQAIYFTIGSGGVGSPHLEAAFDALEIDVDVVSGGVPTTVLTLTADVNLGLNVGTRHDAGLPLGLETTRVALSVANPSVEVFDPRYGVLDAADLDVLAGTIADVLFSTLGADAGTYRVPGPAGQEVSNVSVGNVITTSDDFLAISASIGGAAPPIGAPAPMPQPLSTTLVVPTLEEIRTALLTDDEPGLPSVHVALPTMDGARFLEHAWRTEGGAWHPYEATSDLVIRDRSFAWFGERTIELRSRVVGDDSTTSPIGSTVVILDSAPPTIFSDQAIFSTFLVVPARDAVSMTLEWAMGRVGENTPATGWTTDPNLDAATALSLGNQVIVYVRDELGNVARSTEIQLPEPSSTLAAFCAFGTLALLRRARRRRGNTRFQG